MKPRLVALLLAALQLATLYTQTHAQYIGEEEKDAMQKTA